ncbi:hypothetical protein SALBM311S_09895 [Streptomyces alboniger]
MTETGLRGRRRVDDDVTLDPGCLSRLVRDFRAAGYRGAVGATKVPHTKEFTTSRLLARAKAIAAPATNYPHGCCILVGTDVLSGGLPGRYVSDDDVSSGSSIPPCPIHWPGCVWYRTHAAANTSPVPRARPAAGPQAPPQPPRRPRRLAACRSSATTSATSSSPACGR